MSSAATVFPLGREALSWVRQGGRPTRIGGMQRFVYRWQSYWFERNLSLQRRLQPISISPLVSDPVFILGLWRSGTTFLHDLLGVCPGMICPVTWQCMNPSTFRLRPPPLAGKTALRPIDGFAIDTFSPQEDEFALLALGVPSVYRGFFDPRRMQELAQWLDPDVWAADSSAGWMAPWREFLAGVAHGGPLASQVAESYVPYSCLAERISRCGIRVAGTRPGRGIFFEQKDVDLPIPTVRSLGLGNIGAGSVSGARILLCCQLPDPRGGECGEGTAGCSRFRSPDPFTGGLP